MSRAIGDEGALPASRPGAEGVESVDATTVDVVGDDRRSGRSARAGSRRAAGWLPWLAMALVLAVALVVGTTDDPGTRTNAERSYALARQVKCPKCAGQSVAESDVVISRELRRDIASRVEAGQTDEEILASYAASYGDAILMEPSTSGATGIVWLLPVVALAAGLGAVVVVFRRWRSADTAAATAGDRALVAEVLADEDRAGAARPGGGDAGGGEVDAAGADDGDEPSAGGGVGS